MTRYRNLIEFRTRRGIRQDELAARLGIARSHLSMLENRTRTASLPLAVVIGRRCRVPLTSLIAKGDEWQPK